jgi:hypothetical protein
MLPPASEETKESADFRGKTETSTDPFHPVGFLRATVGQLVAASATKVSRTWGQVQFADPPVARRPVDDVGTREPPPLSAKSRKRPLQKYASARGKLQSHTATIRPCSGNWSTSRETRPPQLTVATAIRSFSPGFPRATPMAVGADADPLLAGEAGVEGAEPLVALRVVGEQWNPNGMRGDHPLIIAGRFACRRFLAFRPRIGGDHARGRS